MFRKRMWAGITAVVVFLLAFVIAAAAICYEWAPVVNQALDVTTSEIITSEESTETDTQYFKSEFGEMNKENQKKLVEATWEQNVNEMKEGAALLKNDNDALPLKKNARVTLVGHAQVDPMYAGVSAGSKPAQGYNPTLFEAMKDDGFGVNETVYNMLKGTGTTRGGADAWGVWTYGSAWQSEDPIGVYTDEIKASWASDYQDAVIYNLCRMGGEHEDMNIYDMKAYTKEERNYQHRLATKEGRVSSLALIQEEKDLLSMLKAEKAAGRFKKIIVILNTSSQMEVNWLDEYDVDACMFVGATGAQGARGISSILSGETNPSGHLVDTYAADSTSAPAVANFGENTGVYTNHEEISKINQEGDVGENGEGGFGSGSYMTFQAESIYIGYKYYETRYEDYILGRGKANSAKGASFGATEWKYQDEISYPFGHGLSYTTFEQKLGDVRYNAETDMYELKVTVKNTGKVAGKSVVQVYAQTPYGDYEKTNKVEKSAIQLAGFGKTGVIEPGKEETITVEAERYLLASYDYTKAKGYILSEGDYYLAIGDNAHDALNNVLKAKNASGMVDFDGTPAAGDANKVYKFTMGLDTDAYKLSSNNIVVTNRFDDCDLNYWVKGAGTYLTRSDWDGTFPTETTAVAVTPEMMKLLKGDYYEKPADSPTLAEATKGLGKNKNITFVTMKDVEWEDDVMWNEFLSQLTLDELVSTVMCQGGRNPIESIALPQTKVADGCDGIGGNLPFEYEDTTGKWGHGAVKLPTCRYASKTTLTGTFNKDLYKRRGELMGEEGLWTKSTEVWGIGADLHRTPFGGRAFEYMSEDANMSYMAAIPEVIAMEKKGMLAGVKHFCSNDQEWQRAGVSIFFNEQAFREGALRGFEGALRVAKCKSLMQSFSRIGLRFASACPALNIDVCDNEWGFKGHKETDATSNQEKGYLAHYVTQLASGTDTFCYNQSAAGKIINDWMKDNDDGNFVKYVMGAAKHFYYAMSRSVAINGLSSDSIVVKVTPWWQNAFIAAIVVLAVLTAACVVMLTLSVLKDRKDRR